MSIRIGSSCVMSLSMALGKVVETRRFYDGFSGWQEVAQNAIKNKQYLIVTPCNHNDKTVKYLNNTQWVNFIDDTCKYLIGIGANRYNARISLINEPMKYISREKYADLINLAYPIVKSYGLLCGAGNEEFVTAQARDNMYQYILNHCQFDILDIHIQGSCNSKADTDKWIAEVKSWINYWQKPVDCTEAFYGDIRTQAGYDLLCYQLKKADEIKCPNFCNVFNNLDKSAFPYQDSTDQWHKLCFKINGDIRSVYWVLWMDEIAGSGPEPNIKEEEMEYLRPDELQAVYDAFNLKTPYHYKTPNLFVVGEKDPSKPFTWADADAMEETRMKALISGLKKLNVLPSDFPDYPNIKYNSDGSWNGKWLEYAKSKPKEGL
jgi:hypothetical protein